MNFYLPNNLNFDELIEKHPPQIQAFDKWELLYFVHIVSYLPSVSKKLRHEESGFVNLSSVLLQSVVHNYKEYINYLLLNDILQANPKFLPGAFPKSYRLTLEYACSPFVNVRVGNIQFAEIAKRHTGITPVERRKVLSEYGHLIRQFEGLEYNFEAATKYIGNMQFQTLGLPGYSDIKYESDRMREIEFNNMLLRDKDFQCKVDDSSERFHSVLTRLKREFRHFLTYKSEPLVSLDIKCSQPYIAQRLLMPQFWLQPAGSGSRGKPGPKKKSEVESRRRLEKFLGGTMGDIIEHTASDWGIQVAEVEDRINESLRGAMEKIKYSTPMLVHKTQLNDNQSIERFSNLVNCSDIYEHVLKIIVGKLQTDSALKQLYDEAPFSLNRNSMKELVLRGMYSPSKSRNPTSKLIHKIFAEEFPGVERIFNAIKDKVRGQYRVLALLLQAVESEIILNRVCKQLVHKNWHIPFFTIHDSILTIPKYKDIVIKTMEEEFEKAIKVKPRIKEEDYSINAMNPIAATLTKSENEFVSLEDILEEEGDFAMQIGEELSE